METQNIHPKAKANAISAYLLLLVSASFLLNKENEYLNNSFVKSHVKSALFIHTSFLITYIIFVSNNLFGIISIFQFPVSDIIAKTLFLFLLFLLIHGIYKAHNGKKFESLEIFKGIQGDGKKIIDINGDGKFREKDKLTILISYIPFLGFLNYGKYHKNEIIRNNTKINLLLTFIIFLLYLFGHYNLGNIGILFYSIFLVFVGISMFAKNEIISFNVQKFPTIKELSYITKSLGKYIKNYFGDKTFVSMHDIVTQKIAEDNKKEENEIEILKNKKISKLPIFLVYTPYINLIFLFIKNTKYYFHIRNGITITILLILSQIASYFGYYNSSLNALFIIPILFGIGFSKNESIYKMAFIYDIYEFGASIGRHLKIGGKKIQEKRKEENQVNLKVEK